MTSVRKIRANRANARISTGPKTLFGRARSAKNALRHGLSVPVEYDHVLCDEVQALARQIAGPNTSADIQILARRIAEAQVDLRRVRYARHLLLSQALSNYDAKAQKQLAVICDLLRRKEPIPRETLVEFLASTPAISKQAEPRAVLHRRRTPANLQQYCCRRLSTYAPLTATNGERSRGASLPFGPSMRRAAASRFHEELGSNRHADQGEWRVVETRKAPPVRIIILLQFWQNEAKKINPFSVEMRREATDGFQVWLVAARPQLLEKALEPRSAN